MLTSSELLHLHLLLNHFPTVGLVVALGLLILALLKQSEDLKRGAFAVTFVLALIALPTYMTGYAAQRALRNVADISRAAIDVHQRSALLGLIALELTGALAWCGLWQSRRDRSAGPGTTASILLLSVLTVGLMAGTARLGGEIRHPEMRVDSGAAIVAGVLAPSWLSSEFITKYQNRHAWAWKTLETIHFMGLCLLFGVVIVGNVRLLGMMREAPLAGIHALLPWAVCGFAANAVTGMLFFIGQTFQYIENPAFHLKMLCILLAGLDVLYLTWHDEVWALGPGASAPMMVKLFAASQICLWVGVIYFGRMLPYIGDAF